MTDKNVEALKAQLRNIQESVDEIASLILEPTPTPADHGPRLCNSSGGYYIVRRSEGKFESFVNNTWSATRPGDEWSCKADALRALAKATGYEIVVVPNGNTCWVASGPYRIDHYGHWQRHGGEWFIPFTAEAIARDCDARGHYPAEMCDTSGVPA